MTTFALIHGAWGSGWHWASIRERLRALGHRVVAPDLPCDDPRATFEDYAQVVLDALASDTSDDVIVVGFSLGGLTTPLVAARRPVRGLVYVAALLAEPGTSLRDRFARGGGMLLPDYLSGIEGPDEQGITRWVDLDVYSTVGYSDATDREVVRERFERLRPQATGPYAHPCSLEALPDLPTRYVMCSDDRLMNNDFWRRAVPAELGVEPVEIGSSHSPMVARPEELTRLLVL